MGPGRPYNPPMDDVLVRLPPALRGFAGGEAELRSPSGTVGQVLGRIGARHPELLARVLDADGGLRPLVNLFVGRANIRSLQGLATPVPPGEVLSILPAVAGG
jgi:molybdopterin converting factor small subunit